ncbi:DUF4280 domain-containing protein [Epilithonimonas sp. JDS]|uniref:DUF4280 domain-containing protein n=1 Tax=Epilithonimonas sp. JDS TaxID=2902797 RepID=UPI001E37B8FC|nr:DUF4280 domain-containing protein [Epilithonimonas sp. JDS]MCD9853275.1 DUF4280 domain-containing protein [Epilithonimonas sp. JDS]
MKKYPDRNNVAGQATNSSESEFSLPENNNEIVDGDFNGFDDEVDEGIDTMEEDSQQEDAENPTEQEEKDEEKQTESSSSEHDGKYFVIQKGMACCDKGAKFPNFKVSSHQKHYLNDEKGEADYLAVTEDDLTFNPPAMPFGTCSIKNGNPCTYSPAGKWTKTYDKVKIMGKSAVTELSELMCTIGGKITVMKHGQQGEAGKSNVKKADAREQHVYNPIMDFEEFQEEITGQEGEAW